MTPKSEASEVVWAWAFDRGDVAEGPFEFDICGRSFAKAPGEEHIARMDVQQTLRGGHKQLIPQLQSWIGTGVR